MIRLLLFGDESEIGDYLRLAPRLCAERNVTLVDGNPVNKAGSYRDEWDSDEFDAVVFCSEDCRYHSPPAALFARKHVLLTTRLTNPREAGALFEQSQEYNVRLMDGFSHRFRPALQVIKQSLDDGQLGEPGLLRIHHWQPHTDLITDAVSDVDLAIWMFGALPTEVYAVRRRLLDSEPGYLQIHLGFPGGGMAVLDSCNSVASGDGYFSLSMVGSSGAAHADDHHNQQLLFRGENPIAVKTGEGDAARLSELKEFIDAIQEQREPLVTCDDARAALQVCHAAWESVAHRRAARLVGDRYEF